jgi:predicted hotdog family 3-hydroxylacyl-ACP dehydratase
MIRELGRHYAIRELLPHGPSMVLLDRVLEYGHEHIVCEAVIDERSAFFEPGRGVPGWVGVEYMAQATGAYAGIMHRQAGRAVQIGLLLGTRAYECTRAAFPAGTRLQVRAALLLLDVGGVAVFRCEIGDGATIVARSELKAFQPEDVDGYLAALEAAA